MQRPLVEGLAQKLGTRPAPMNPMLLPTTGHDRRDSAVALDLVSRRVSISLAAESGNEPRRQNGSGTRERFHERIVGVLTRQRIDLFVIASNGREKLFQQTGPSHHS